MKKRIICVIVLLQVLFGSFTIEPDCNRALHKIEDYYKRQSEQRFIYLKYSNWTVENGVKGQALTSQLWMDQEELKVKYENDYMLLYQDKEVQVTILKDAHNILINDSENKMISPGTSPSQGFSADSLVKYATAATFAKASKGFTINISYPTTIDKRPNTLRRVVLESTNGGELIKTVYAHEAVNAKQEQITLYEKAGYHFDKTILKGSALSVIMNGKNLKAEYSKYSVKDLRKKH